MIDSDLAVIYQVETKRLMQQVNRNKEDNKLYKEQTHVNTKNIKLALEYLQQILEDTQKTEEKVMGFRVDT